MRLSVRPSKFTEEVTEEIFGTLGEVAGPRGKTQLEALVYLFFVLLECVCVCV
jgi:hypothetical protein